MTKQKLNPNARKWVRALRSGKYQQARKVLGRVVNGETRYCCLGVACEIYNKSVPKDERLERIEEGGEVSYAGEAKTLPEKVREWLGLQGTVGEIHGEAGLSARNDNGVRFKTIADVIESQPEGLFSR